MNAIERVQTQDGRQDDEDPLDPDAADSQPLARPGDSLEKLTQLTSAIAHELSGVLLTAAMFLDSVPAELAEPHESIVKVAALVQQAQSLSASLLEVASGFHHRRSRVLDIGAWLPQSIQRFTDELPRGMTINLRPLGGKGEDGEEVVVEAQTDPLALELVLRTLVANAVEAQSGEGEVQISLVPARQQAAGAAHIEIAVSDLGPGVAPADRSRIFDATYSTKKRPRRSGLGLSIACCLVEQMNGSLSYRPNTPKGATFVIRLPATRKGSR